MRKAALLLFLFSGITCLSQVAVSKNNSQIHFKLENDTTVLLSLDKSNFLSAQHVNTQAAQNIFETKPQKTFLNAEIDSIYQFDNSYFLTGILADNFPFEVGFFFDEKVTHKYWISVKVEDAEAKLSTLQFRFKTDAKHFWGGGLQSSISDFSRKEFTGAVSSFDTSAQTQLPIPKFCTEKDFCFELKPVECTVKFDTSGVIEASVFPYRKDDYWLFNIEFDKSSLMNQQPLNSLPDWIHGAILKTDFKHLKKHANNILKQKQNGLPISAVLITDFSVLNLQNSTILRENIKQLNKARIKAICNFSPLIEVQNTILQDSTKLQYLVQNYLGEPYKIELYNQKFFMVDLFNPKAAEWYKQIIKTRLIDLGISSWIANNSNLFPYNAKIPEGFTPQTAHNFYTVIWARINREVLQENGLDDSCLVFLTSGSAGIERYAKAFTVSSSTTKNELQHSINIILSAANSGLVPILLYFNSPKNDYWNALQSFLPFYFVNHSTLKKHTSKFLKIHYLLKDYFKESVGNGSNIKPLNTLFYQAIDSNFKYQFLVGNDLLIAPHINSVNSNTSVKFPEGNWRNIFDSNTQPFTTNQIVEIEFKSSAPAIFVRIGSKLDSLVSRNRALFAK